MKAKIVSLNNGLQEYDDLDMIRLKSKTHTLLIMPHFMPVIGELDGSIELVYEEHSIFIDGLNGYYMHKQDEFSLLVENGDTTEVVRREE